MSSTLHEYANYHSVDTSAVAGLDQKLDIGVHEGRGHGNSRTVWEDKVGVLAETLDNAEDVVPSSAVQSRGVITKLVDDLLQVLDRSCRA